MKIKNNSRKETNSSLRRFCSVANKKYFSGKLDVITIRFSNKLKDGRHGETQSWTYQRWWGPRATHRPEEKIRSRILISTHLRCHRDLCMMTVYHEMVHAELDSLGIRGRENSCRKSGTRFNQRMTELAQAGAFNGLW